MLLNFIHREKPLWFKIHHKQWFSSFLSKSKTKVEWTVFFFSFYMEGGNIC